MRKNLILANFVSFLSCYQGPNVLSVMFRIYMLGHLKVFFFWKGPEFYWLIVEAVFSWMVYWIKRRVIIFKLFCLGMMIQLSLDFPIKLKKFNACLLLLL